MPPAPRRHHQVAPAATPNPKFPRGGPAVLQEAAFATISGSHSDHFPRSAHQQLLPRISPATLGLTAQFAICIADAQRIPRFPHARHRSEPQPDK